MGDREELLGRVLGRAGLRARKERCVELGGSWLRLGCSERLHGPRAQESVPLPRGRIQLQEQRVQRRSHDRCLNRDMSAISRHHFHRCSYVAVATLSCHQLRCNTLFHSPLLPLIFERSYVLNLRNSQRMLWFPSLYSIVLQT